MPVDGCRHDRPGRQRGCSFTGLRACQSGMEPTIELSKSRRRHAAAVGRPPTWARPSADCERVSADPTISERGSELDPHQVKEGLG